MKYRIRVCRGGFEGYVKVQRRASIFKIGLWQTMAEFSIFGYGVDGAFKKANDLVNRLESHDDHLERI